MLDHDETSPPSRHRLTTGDRLRIARRARGLSAAQLAQKVAISPSYVQKLESGKRKPSPALVLALAKALHLGPEALTGQPHYGEPESDDGVYAVLPELRRALLCYDSPDDLPMPPRPLPVLASEVDQVAALRRDARYVPMGPLLAPVITELTHIALDGRESDRYEAFRQLARCYRAVNSLAHKTGHHDLSHTALERVRWAAGRSGDPLLPITAGYLVAGAMLRHGAYAPARRQLRALRAELAGMRPAATQDDVLAVHGAVLLKLAVLEARENAPERARDRLREAEDVARAARNRDSLAYEMSFGPTNIRIHELHTALVTGDTERALALPARWSPVPGGEWTPPAGTAGERSSHHFIDLASARLAAGDRTGAFAALKRARKLAPNHTRFHPSVRETSAALLRMDASPPNELVRFGSWAGVGAT
ncbi:helix-turn-helix domain-containing protein [Streptomyces mobaraensis NBRC 13819 = DSM 40847]|uniref:Helix-turn-helix domain-containing protein n=1 Tax=Streptomyces mobaraensis (strain ATCC 29032 / DSM 40847 / JCM 4168 / NBRC 13819 / NCIMB 11159 / IPCR 16-22) TaxID=1223523 RepID=M3AY23_STRM1|nr:helix-turn-helix transcriptional regulator [Streptomyces mobaraensis]EME98522.1 helix-turn-helix domain-containing protein [Streptomyces mobaraensis NBRC 13819 = DSM 40847]QTT75422.1 helix-turn-helix domain-containing protein [Streptomyces mobaraensis NBRC 13819 = DSM 40847]